MSLRLKVFFILTTILLLYTLFDYGIQRFIVFPNFIALEQEEAKEDAIRCIEAIQREIHHLDLINHDWSAWTDTYEFIENKNREYVETNLQPGSYQTAKLNLIYILQTDGTVLWGKTYLLDTLETILKRKPKPLREEQRQFYLSRMIRLSGVAAHKC